MIIFRFAVTVVFATVVRSQTFVVDANSGPGTDFTSLPTAVAAVPDGSTLVVRPASYEGFSVVGKGLTILGEDGAAIDLAPFPKIDVMGTNANQRFVVRGIHLGRYGVPGLVSFQFCQGLVHLEHCRSPASGSCGLVISSCSEVSIAHCAFRSTGTLFAQSDVVCRDTQLSLAGFSGDEGLEIVGGRTCLARCSVQGGPGFWSGSLGWLIPPGPGITLNTGELRLLGPGTVIGPNGAPSIAGTGSVHVTSTIVLQGASIPFTTIDEAATSSADAAVGGTVVGTAEGSASLLGGLMLGLPLAPQLVVPGVGGELWLNPFGFMTIGVLGTPLTYTATIPNDPLLRGAVFGWQGMTWEPNAGFVLSNPAWFCVR